MNRELAVIGVQMDFGQSRRGINMGPSAIRYAGLLEGLEYLGYQVCDKGDIIPMQKGKSLKNMRNYEQVIDGNFRLFWDVTDSLKSGMFPIILGGDHSIAAGSVSAVSKFYEEEGGIGVIWIDAHGDWNNDETSPTGNMHGMPFSAVCGYGPDIMADFGQVPAYVDVKKCVQIGGRDIDTEERKRMKEAGVTVFPMNAIDKLGMNEVIGRAVEIAGSGTAGIHLSFDIDAVTPEAAPGTGTVVHSGLTAREAFFAMEVLAESRKLLSMDMVEVNPILDEKNKTAILASELIQSALGKTVY
ncbi:MAG: arginase [Eubacterium sp.]|nr:arginase [Eubacterium sp.]